MSETTLTGGQMIVDGLIRQGVEVVFAVPGHGNTALLDAFVDREDEITVVQAMHEQGASHMADGYYRASGKIAAVCTSIGPGATNTVTGIATAFADSQPQLVLTGSVHTYLENRGVLQEIDRPHGANWGAVIEPVVKRWWRPVTLGQIPRVVSQAFAVLREGRRGPVLLDVPQDLQAEAGVYEPVEGAPPDLPRPTGNIEAIRQAAELL
ncbi:MAG: thiamine pyrophosphate-binding protein, partial [Acidimicrobiales bacterium]